MKNRGLQQRLKKHVRHAYKHTQSKRLKVEKDKQLLTISNKSAFSNQYHIDILYNKWSIPKNIDSRAIYIICQHNQLSSFVCFLFWILKNPLGCFRNFWSTMFYTVVQKQQAKPSISC